MKILWIGFGKMGEPMALRAAAAGFELTVFDASKTRMAAAASHGLATARDAGEAAAAADAIVSSLPNDAAALAVLGSTEGILAKARRSAVLIETSTISVAASAEVARIAATRDVAYVRAPVSGTVDAAAEGRLTSILSGPDEAQARARTLVESYSAKLMPVGETEQARVMKLAINLMVTTLIASLAEAYALCRKGGIDPTTALRAIGDSAIGSPHLRFKAASLERGDFSPTFTVSQIRKDMRLINEAGRDLGVPLIVGAAVDQIMTATDAVGLSEEDYVACAKLVAQLAGLAEPSR